MYAQVRCSFFLLPRAAVSLSRSFSRSLSQSVSRSLSRSSTKTKTKIATKMKIDKDWDKDCDKDVYDYLSPNVSLSWLPMLGIPSLGWKFQSWGDRLTQVPPTCSMRAWRSIRAQPWSLNGNSQPRNLAGTTCADFGGQMGSAVPDVMARKRGGQIGACITARSATCRHRSRLGRSSTALASRCGCGSKQCGMSRIKSMVSAQKDWGESLA